MPRASEWSSGIATANTVRIVHRCGLKREEAYQSPVTVTATSCLFRHMHPSPSFLSTQVLIQQKKKRNPIFIQYSTSVSTYLYSTKYQKNPCALRSHFSTQAVPPVVQAREKGMGRRGRGVRERKEGRWACAFQGCLGVCGGICI
jgi:hypothetical protein